jgi:hypothetical protein
MYVDRVLTTSRETLRVGSVIEPWTCVALIVVD